MSKPRKPPKSRTNVVSMATETAGNVAVAENEPETPFDTPPPPPIASQPPPPAERPAEKPRKLSFFQRVAAIPKAEWGTRVFIYVYCLEPICNLKQGGETKYLVKLTTPIEDENPLMIDYGSGKYRLQMVNRKPGAEKQDAIDTIEVEIYNPKYPPKIPRSVWMNDPRNERWAALLPKEEPPAAPTGLGTVTDAFKTFTEIRKDLRDEMAPPPAAATPPPADPIDAGLRIAQMMITMKADNPMVDIMKEQMKMMQESNMKALEREAALQKELRDSLRAPSQQGEKFGLKQILGELKEFLPGIKELMPQVAETARAGRTNWLDVAQSVAPGVIDWAGKIALAVASRQPIPPQQNGQQHAPQQIAGPQQPNAGVTPPSGGSAPPQQQQEVPKFVQFLSQPIAFDAFRRYFDGYKKGEGQTGGDFASWVFDGGGIEHMKEARAMGSANIMAFLKRSQAWILFQADEAKLVEFVDQALAWMPPPDDEDGDEDDEDEAVDLTRKGV